MSDVIEQRLREAATSDAVPIPLRRLRARARRRRAGTVLAAPLSVVAVVLGVAQFLPNSMPATVPSAAVEQQGVRIELSLDRSRVALGDVLNATVTVTNTTSTDVQWHSDACRELVKGHVALTIKEDPVQLDGSLTGRFRARALERQPESTGPLVPLDKLDNVTYGCAQPLVIIDLPAGAVRNMDLAWRATAPDGARVEGPARATVEFGLETASQRGIQVTAPFEVVSGAVQPSSRADAVDTALADLTFVAWLKAQPTDTWRNGFTFLSADSRTWTVGLVYARPTGNGSGLVRLDAFTGQILERDLR